MEVKATEGRSPGGRHWTELDSDPLDFSLWTDQYGSASPSQLPEGRDQFSFGVLESTSLNERKILPILQGSTQVEEK